MAIKKKTTTKSKSTTKKTAPKKKAVPKKKAAPKSKKPAFGGYAINFAGRNETVEDVFGKKPIAPSEMTKKIWAFVKSQNLANR